MMVDCFVVVVVVVVVVALRSSCFLLSLPLFHGIVQTTVRGRHFVTANPTGKTISVVAAEDWHKGQCLLLKPPASMLHAMIAGEFRLDALKIAALQFHPYWLLGEHDAAQLHRGMPFVHRHHHHNNHHGPDDDEESSPASSWRPVTNDQVREILDEEGPKNLLLLPPLIKWEGGHRQNTVPAPPPPQNSNTKNNDGRQNHVWYCHEQ
jgi:hypothetical protein